MTEFDGILVSILREFPWKPGQEFSLAVKSTDTNESHRNNKCIFPMWTLEQNHRSMKLNGNSYEIRIKAVECLS